MIDVPFESGTYVGLPLSSILFFEAGDESRTRDLQLGKLPKRDAERAFIELVAAGATSAEEQTPEDPGPKVLYLAI